MRKVVVLAVGLVVLGAIGLWATESKELDLAKHLGGAHALATPGEFSSVLVLNETGAIAGSMGWWRESSDFWAKGDGAFFVNDMHGNARVTATVVNGGHGVVGVYDAGGNNTAYMSAEIGFWSKNGDIAESFPSAVPEIKPGSVLVLDPQKPGALTISTQAYDRRVAGVASGASDYKPAMTLGKRDAAGHVPVTLTGTAYTLVTNSNGPIKAGDLLTTSNIPGHAMKVTDFAASQGAILGKAMQDFDEETGLVMILAALQ
jgi:hypothetical protein